MKKEIGILILFFQIILGLSIHSQSENNNCQTLGDLKPLDAKVKENIITHIKGYINQIENKNNDDKVEMLYCPQSELYFDLNCNFPKNHKNINFYLGLLFEKPNSKLLLKVNNDKISYKKNPEFNTVRAETVKKIFTFFGINENRIVIKDLKDEQPIATNKNEEGRVHNRYIRMSVEW